MCHGRCQKQGHRDEIGQVVAPLGESGIGTDAIDNRQIAGGSAQAPEDRASRHAVQRALLVHGPQIRLIGLVNPSRPDTLTQLGRYRRRPGQQGCRSVGVHPEERGTVVGFDARLFQPCVEGQE